MLVVVLLTLFVKIACLVQHDLTLFSNGVSRRSSVGEYHDNYLAALSWYIFSLPLFSLSFDWYCQWSRGSDVGVGALTATRLRPLRYQQIIQLCFCCGDLESGQYVRSQLHSELGWGGRALQVLVH